MTLQAVGYGLGTRNPSSGRPNALRLLLGETDNRYADRIAVLEATIDDATPELTGFVQERLAEAGVLDVFLTPVIMKKSRPGTNVTVLTDLRTRDRAMQILFDESPTLGVRFHEVEREVLERRFVPVTTRYGRVRVKVGLRGRVVVNAAPEYEDCRLLARAKNVSLTRVQRAALSAYEAL